MEDWGARLEELLGDGELLSQLAGLLSPSGSGQEASDTASPQHTAAAAPPFDLGALAGLDLSALLGTPGGGSGLDMAMLGRILQAVNSLSAPDPNTQLLMALQPFCGTARRKKVEDAARMLQLLRLLPLLQDPKEG